MIVDSTTLLGVAQSDLSCPISLYESHALNSSHTGLLPEPASSLLVPSLSSSPLAPGTSSPQLHLGKYCQSCKGHTCHLSWRAWPCFRTDWQGPPPIACTSVMTGIVWCLFYFMCLLLIYYVNYLRAETLSHSRCYNKFYLVCTLKYALNCLFVEYFL